MPGDDEDLADRVAELERTVADLRRVAVDPPRGPLGVPRPPTPREAIRLTRDSAIPAAIAVLEANVRTLELLRDVLRVVDRREGGSDDVEDRARRVGEATLERLDDALDDLVAALEGEGAPADPEARQLLADARRLDAEIRERLAATGAGADGSRSDPTEGGTRIDVEEELDTIKRQVDDEDG